MYLSAFYTHAHTHILTQITQKHEYLGKQRKKNQKNKNPTQENMMELKEIETP